MSRHYVLMSYKKFIIAALVCTSLVSCSDADGDFSSADPIDRVAGLSVDDYKAALQKKKERINSIEKKAPPIPTPSSSLVAPRAPKIGSNKTVSLSVTDEVPLKDVFIELSRLSDVDIEVDPSITGGVIFKVQDKPFGEVIERLTSLAKLRYSVTSGVLRIEPDYAHIINYPVNFLNLSRSGSGGVSVSTSVLSASAADSGGLTTGGQSAVTASYDGDLWPSVESGITAIIGDAEGVYVNINRQGGVISVNANDEIHDRVGNYLKQVSDYYSSQVLVEAKVVEVQLNDQFRSGVNWSDFNILSGLGFGDISITTPGASSTDFPASVASIDFSRDGGDLAAAVDLVQIFGTTRTISSPRIVSMNNQQSIFTFARNEIYFTVSIEEETEEVEGGDDITTLNVESEVNSVPIGIILSVQPSIDEKRGEIIMNLRPTISRTTGVNVPDPGFALQVASILARFPGEFPENVADLTNSIPEVEVRELDTVLRMKTGEVMAIGGMIEQRDNNIDSGVPFISEIPIFGNAFKSVEKESNTVQTVILLKATIIPGYGVDARDQEFYNKFSTEPRPFEF